LRRWRDWDLNSPSPPHSNNQRDPSCGKPHVRWCGRVVGRNPGSSTQSNLRSTRRTRDSRDSVRFRN
jgi:hypothetical protein